MPSATAVPSPVVSASDRVYDLIKGRILSGELVGGTMISEGEAAEATGLSRTPVREAFLRLQAEDWLTLYPKRGALVRLVAPGEADAVLDARRMVETHAAEHLCSLPSETRRAALAPLADVLAAQRAAIADGDLAAYSSSDARFHQQIVALAGNDLVTAFYVSIRERQERVVAHSVRRDLDRAAAFVADHERLAAHLLDGDAAAFATALDAHLDSSREARA